MPTWQKMAFAKSPTFSITFLKCIASCWPIFIFGLHFPGTLIFVPCAKSFVLFTFRSRGPWGRPNVPTSLAHLCHCISFEGIRRSAAIYGPWCSLSISCTAGNSSHEDLCCSIYHAVGPEALRNNPMYNHKNVRSHLGSRVFFSRFVSPIIRFTQIVYY